MHNLNFFSNILFKQDIFLWSNLNSVKKWITLLNIPFQTHGHGSDNYPIVTFNGFLGFKGCCPNPFSQKMLITILVDGEGIQWLRDKGRWEKVTHLTFTFNKITFIDKKTSNAKYIKNLLFFPKKNKEFASIFFCS